MTDNLQELSGIGETTSKKLDDNGYESFLKIAVASPTEISNLCGISEVKARVAIREARDKLKMGFEVAREYAKKRDKVKKIGIGSDSFDEMLGGGFDSGSIIEVYGKTASGKTQLSHLMTVRALMDSPDSKSIFIDSENTFRADRIKDFSEALSLDYEDIMNRIYVARSYTVEHQMLLVDELEKLLQKDNSYRLLVIDSLTSHFRAAYSGRGELAPRQQMLNKHLHQLLKIADIYNLVVILTNQVSSNPGIVYGNPEMPIGGNILSHSVTSIIYLRPGKAGSIVAKLVDSPSLPPTEANYFITKEGFKDV